METRVPIRLKMTKNISNKELREFALIIGIFFPLIIGLILPYLYGHGFRLWTIFFSLPFLIILAISNPPLLVINKIDLISRALSYDSMLLG